MPSKYVTTSNLGYDENMHYVHHMGIVVSEGLPSPIALFKLRQHALLSNNCNSIDHLSWSGVNSYNNCNSYYKFLY